MKMNWGTGIFIAILLFMSFILFFVIKVQSNSKYDNELVVEDYYKMELELQGKLDRERNAVNLVDKVIIDQDDINIKISFPADFDASKIKGKVSLYRPSNQRLDFEIPISISVPYLLIPKNDLAGGRWDIAVEWKYNDTAYLNNKMMTLN
ncbi:MAG: cytochrome C oxidase Cbb3 [Flavobacterium sp. MedPE-SWcel]|uniref:FixH family protein n=1 Tax=uncultured Flavobacterium sp. TaxID=165435 RepID=UPI00092412BD|nr:FixH family protein [uncultured Flavobacterium sp.]OIQ20231.1 MAG: cytochrome C oxidase Cbb3 [Flavobacterium sp. MedPE-SWcel]